MLNRQYLGIANKSCCVVHSLSSSVVQIVPSIHPSSPRPHPAIPRFRVRLGIVKSLYLPVSRTSPHPVCPPCLLLPNSQPFFFRRRPWSTSFAYSTRRGAYCLCIPIQIYSVEIISADCFSFGGDDFLAHLK